MRARGVFSTAPPIALLRRRPNSSSRRTATAVLLLAEIGSLSDRSDRLGQQVAYLTRDRMQCGIIDRLH